MIIIMIIYTSTRIHARGFFYVYTKSLLKLLFGTLSLTSHSSLSFLNCIISPTKTKILYYTIIISDNSSSSSRSRSSPT